MSTLQIALPDNVKAVLDERIASGNYADPSDYLCRLIEEDERRRAASRMEASLVTRLEDDRSVEMNETDWGKIREDFKIRYATRVGQ